MRRCIALKDRQIDEFVEKYESMSRKEKKKSPLISKKDLRKHKDGVMYGLKLRAAAELGLLEDVQKKGWSGLSAAETGRIGGHVSRRMRMQRMGQEDSRTSEG